MKETRALVLHESSLYSVLLRQAGSLAKAVLECVMNSIDAKATRIDIVVTSTHITVQDDGHGLRSREEILKRYEVVGFEHAESGRIYAEFGIGRGQLWCFCPTRWRTQTFQLDSDLKRRGKAYDFEDSLPCVPGLRIEGEFYQPRTTTDLINFETELADLARYAQIPVYLNGRKINKDPAQEKWDFVTDDAFIKLNDSTELAVYNLGVLVRRYNASDLGTGGIVITRPGVQLTLNMARNDIQTADCKVWRRIRKYLQRSSDEKVRKKATRLTDAELENFARRFIAGELSYEIVEPLKLISDVRGKGHTLDEFSRAAARRIPLTIAPQGSALGERAHETKLAFVLSPRTLGRFRAQSVAELISLLRRALIRDPSGKLVALSLDLARIEEDVAKAAPALHPDYIVLKDAELTKEERAGVAALSRMADLITYEMRNRHIVKSPLRKVALGMSDVAQAWTDGQEHIWIEKRLLELMTKGIGGFIGLATILVDQLLYETVNTGSHSRDQQFLERYYEATHGEAAVMFQAVFVGLRTWVQTLHEYGLKIPKTVISHLDLAEGFDRDDPTRH
jgi:Histidine kinase-, DNA gyrase B-, and HSP90-like ATPase